MNDKGSTQRDNIRGLALLIIAVSMPSCHRQTQINQSSVPNIVETQWTRGAAERTEALTNAALKQDARNGGLKFALPRLRVYDGKGQLVYLLDPTKTWMPASIGGEIERAIAGGRAISGPSLVETLADLQTTDGRPAARVVASKGTPLVFDYWASWCVPCKFLEKALLQWQSKKPAGSVQIIKAEADPTKLARQRGQKVFMVKKGPDGKLHKVEMK